MIFNIVDERKCVYAWKDVNAVIENTWQDNSVPDGDYLAPAECDDITYEERIGISLHEAIQWAESKAARVTLYLYSRGDGIEQPVRD
jgi:hypothetical protein